MHGRQASSYSAPRPGCHAHDAGKGRTFHPTFLQHRTRFGIFTPPFPTFHTCPPWQRPDMKTEAGHATLHFELALQARDGAKAGTDCAGGVGWWSRGPKDHADDEQRCTRLPGSRFYDMKMPILPSGPGAERRSLCPEAVSSCTGSPAQAAMSLAYIGCT